MFSGWGVRTLSSTHAFYNPLSYHRGTDWAASRGLSSGLRRYPRANTQQLWNATAFPLAVQSLLALMPLAPAVTLIIHPILPTWMPDVVVRDLRVGRATITLRMWRDGRGASMWEVLHKQ
jgi:glycogen debranching enzyme